MGAVRSSRSSNVSFQCDEFVSRNFTTTVGRVFELFSIRVTGLALV
jgi:hypothetical protein